MLDNQENKTINSIPILNEKGEIIDYYKAEKPIPIIKNKITKSTDQNQEPTKDN